MATDSSHDLAASQNNSLSGPTKNEVNLVGPPRGHRPPAVVQNLGFPIVLAQSVPKTYGFSGPLRWCHTSVCEIKVVLANLTMSRQPPSTLFQCWRACSCECKVLRNKSRGLREDVAEKGNVEIGGTGFPRKPERANVVERHLFRKHRYLATANRSTGSVSCQGRLARRPTTLAATTKHGTGSAFKGPRSGSPDPYDLGETT